MAMIYCNECGKEISDKADKCPHCGCPVNFGKKENTLEKQEKPKNGKIGLIGFIISFVGFIFSIGGFVLIGLIAIIMGIVSLAKKENKKWMAITAIILSVAGFALSPSDSAKERNKTANKEVANLEINSSDSKEEAVEEKEKIYSVGDTWTVDGQWSITINSIMETDYRNQFSEKEPAQVFIIDFVYENIGYEDKSGLMDGLFFDLTNGQIVDSEGFMGYSYPGEVTDYAKETPIGAKCKAQNCIAVDNISSEIKINLSKHDGTGKEQKATFTLSIN